MISEAQLRTTLVQKIQSFDSEARVHRRRRFPAQNRLSEYARLFREGGTGKVNGYMIRRLRRKPLFHGVSRQRRLVSVTYDYQIRFYYGIHDADDDGAASEETAQLKIDLLAEALEADLSLGLGACVKHDGLDMPEDFDDVVLGDAACHRADLRLSVTVANVNC